ncbi:MAG: VapC toxin family PIN domain ribonuclease [Alphaproteobacteria bacterium]|nr:VapC toxin family PIN domain ribonuclease [Alphaproteobacteria bacterium]
MILIDTNLLLYASIPGSIEHEPVRQWLDEQFANTPRIGLPWHSLLGFVRLASDRRVYAAGPSVADAWEAVREWLSIDNVWIPQATDRHVDTHLAALAIEHGLTLCSADRDFARFPKLRWMNPLPA